MIPKSYCDYLILLFTQSNLYIVGTERLVKQTHNWLVWHDYLFYVTLIYFFDLFLDYFFMLMFFFFPLC